MKVNIRTRLGDMQVYTVQLGNMHIHVMYTSIIGGFIGGLPYTPCYLCAGVVGVGSMRFDVLELPRSSARAHLTN